MKTTKIRILKNEAFILIAEITGLTLDQLEKLIINRLTLENTLDPGDIIDAGKSVFEVGALSGYTADELVNVLFYDKKRSTEFNELINAVYFWGKAEGENACINCGCELEFEKSEFNDETKAPEDIFKCCNYECGETKHKKADINEIIYQSRI